MAVTPLDLLAAVTARLPALGAWWSTAAIHFGRRPPNAAEPPYVVVAIREATPAANESDGCALQTFDLEIVGRAIGPADAATISGELVKLDPAPSDPTAGLSLTPPSKIVLAKPLGGKLEMLADLVGGNDQYSIGRAWQVLAASATGR
jgi:hypothetical protein